MALFKKKKSEQVIVPQSTSMQLREEKLMDNTTPDLDDEFLDELPPLPKMESMENVGKVVEPLEDDLDAQIEALKAKKEQKRIEEEQRKAQAQQMGQEDSGINVLREFHTRLTTIESRLFRAGI